MRCTPSRAARLKQTNNNKCCFWMWKNRNPCAMLVGIQNGADTPGNSLAVPREVMHSYPMTQQFHAWIHTRGRLKHVHTKPYTQMFTATWFTRAKRPPAAACASRRQRSVVDRAGSATRTAWMIPDHRGTKRSQIRSPKPRAERVQNRPIHRHGVDQRRPGSGVRGWGVTADGAPRAGQCGGCSAWRTRENAERRAQGERNSQCLKSVSTFT